MTNKIRGPLITSFLGLSLMAISAFTPWFLWAYREGAELWYESTSIWGPPAYILGFPAYAMVDDAGHYFTTVDRIVAIYLVIFLAGIGLWLALLWWSRRDIDGWVLVAVGLVSVLGWMGPLIIFGLGELIAHRVGLYAAVRSDRIITAELIRLQVLGPLILVIGLAGAAGALIWRRRITSTG
jgi:hypothetical protein